MPPVLPWEDMLADELSVQILREIRDEVRATNSRLERLERHVTESAPRLASAVTALTSAVSELTAVLREECFARTGRPS